MKPTEIVLNEKHIEELNNFIQELPLKHGLPLLNFLNKIAQEATKKEEVIAEIPKTIPKLKK